MGTQDQGLQAAQGRVGREGRAVWVHQGLAAEGGQTEGPDSQQVQLLVEAEHNTGHIGDRTKPHRSSVDKLGEPRVVQVHHHSFYLYLSHGLLPFFSYSLYFQNLLVQQQPQHASSPYGSLYDGRGTGRATQAHRIYGNKTS